MQECKILVKHMIASRLPLDFSAWLYTWISIIASPVRFSLTQTVALRLPKRLWCLQSPLLKQHCKNSVQHHPLFNVSGVTAHHSWHTRSSGHHPTRNNVSGASEIKLGWIMELPIIARAVLSTLILWCVVVKWYMHLTLMITVLSVWMWG